MFAATAAELATIDRRLDPLLKSAYAGAVEAEQLALDATRLLSVRSEQLEQVIHQPFFARICNNLWSQNADPVTAATTQLFELQRSGWRYLQLLNERDLMSAPVMITVKNNLLMLAVTETDARQLFTVMAQRITERFVALEQRMDTLEVQQNIHGWLLTLETYDYPDKYPEKLRLLRVIHDFVALKPCAWNITEIKYLQKALKEVELPWRQEITLADFIAALIDEIDKYGFEAYEQLVELFGPQGRITPHFILDNASIPSHKALYTLVDSYVSGSQMIALLADQLTVSRLDALKQILRGLIESDGIDTSIPIPLRDLAVELLNGHGLVLRLVSSKRCALLAQRIALAPYPITAPVALPPIMDIHGWCIERVQALQHSTAMALGRSVVFRDREFKVKLKANQHIFTLAPPEMVVIPAGRCLIGSAAKQQGQRNNEYPQHLITLNQPFALGRYAVTFDEYDAFCMATGRKQVADADWGRDRRPVINVNWYDALDYCQWLSTQTAQHYRLPSEAEWEYATRAGTLGAYFFDEEANLLNRYAWFNSNADSKTQPVGLLQPNPWGLYDLYGNVREWTGSGYENPYSGSEMRCASKSYVGRISIRGGAWSNGAKCIRSAYRLNWLPSDRNAYLGFRVARDDR